MSGRYLCHPPADFAERAPSMSTAQIEREWRIGTPKAFRWLASIGIHRTTRQPKAMPPGFDAAAKNMTTGQLRVMFGLSKYEVERLRKSLGIVVHRERQRIEIPETFRSLAQTMTAPELAERYGVSRNLIATWRKRLGIHVPTPRYHRDGSVKVCGPNARSVEELAANHLRRIAPVYRIGIDGKPNARGRAWKYGNITLSGPDLIARARRRGWNPDAWKEIRA